MELEQTNCNVAEFDWLATLLSRCSETASDVMFQTLAAVKEAGLFPSTRMDAWSKGSIIAKAMAAVSEDLSQSARREQRDQVQTVRTIVSDQWTFRPVSSNASASGGVV